MGWTVAWLLWIFMFFAIEMPAIWDKKPGNTLSEHVWKWFAITGKPKWWRIRRIGLASFLVWLVTHFITGGWM